MSRGIWQNWSSRKINEDDSTEIKKYVSAIYGRKRLASVVLELASGVILEKVQTKGKHVNLKYEKV